MAGIRSCYLQVDAGVLFGGICMMCLDWNICNDMVEHLGFQPRNLSSYLKMI